MSESSGCLFIWLTSLLPSSLLCLSHFFLSFFALIPSPRECAGGISWATFLTAKVARRMRYYMYYCSWVRWGQIIILHVYHNATPSQHQRCHLPITPHHPHNPQGPTVRRYLLHVISATTSESASADRQNGMKRETETGQTKVAQGVCLHASSLSLSLTLKPRQCGESPRMWGSYSLPPTLKMYIRGSRVSCTSRRVGTSSRQSSEPKIQGTGPRDGSERLRTIETT